MITSVVRVAAMATAVLGVVAPDVLTLLGVIVLTVVFGCTLAWVIIESAR